MSLAGGGAVPFRIAASTAAQGCLQDPAFLNQLTLQIDQDIQPGQQVYLEGDYHLCPPACNAGNIHTDLYRFSWEGSYESACGQAYATPSQEASLRSYRPTPIQILAPFCLSSTQPNLVSICLERGPGIFVLNPGGFTVAGTPIGPDYAFEWELTLSDSCTSNRGACGTNPSIPLVWPASAVFPLANGVWVRFTEATRPAGWQEASFAHSLLRFPILSQCQAGGASIACIGLGGSNTPSLTVAGFFTPSLS